MKGKGVFGPVPPGGAQTALFSVKSLVRHGPFARPAVEKGTGVGNVRPPARPCEALSPQTLSTREQGHVCPRSGPVSFRPSPYVPAWSPRSGQVPILARSPHSSRVTTLMQTGTRATHRDAAPTSLGLDSN